MSVRSKVVDVEISVIKGRDFKNSHKLGAHPSHVVELALDNETKKTNPVRSENGDISKWNASFVYSATASSNVKVRAYCTHQHLRKDHVIGEASFDALRVGRYEDFEIALHDPAHPTQDSVAGYVTLCVKVAVSVTFDTGRVTNIDLRSQSSLRQMERMIGSLSPEGFKKLSPSWISLFNALGTFSPVAQKVAELDSRAKIAVNAVAFAIKTLVDQIDRDEKVDNLGTIMQRLYAYVLDLSSTQKILSYTRTLECLLTQTSECAYFIAEYKRITIFAQRVVVNLIVSNADAMISKFEAAFGELKVELILGSSLQTTIVSYRILRKLENMENVLLYIDKIPALKNVTWDSGKTCLRGTRKETIGDIVRWASKFSDVSSNSRIYILSGCASFGKTTIAHTVAQAFHEQGRLGAGVFLHKDVAGATAQTISSSIAQQLASFDPQFKTQIAEKIRSDQSLAYADVSRQFQALVVEATSVGVDGNSQSLMIGPVLILIDGLDTIDEEEQCKLLTVIADYAKKLPLNFRIFITSRPNDLVEATLGSLSYSEVHKIGLDDSASEPSLNLTEYISQCVRDLFREKPHLAESWNEGLESQFRRRARGMYFWVSLAHRALMVSSNDGDSAVVVNLLSNKHPYSNEETINHLYKAILKTVRDRHSSESLQVVFDILIKSTDPITLSNLHDFTGIPDDESRVKINNTVCTLQEFGLVIETGKGPVDSGIHLGVHPSLNDFLTNPRRSTGTDIFVDKDVPSKLKAVIPPVGMTWGRTWHRTRRATRFCRGASAVMEILEY